MIVDFKKFGDRVFARMDLSDGFIIGGLVMACVGVWQIYPPAALITVGVALFWLGIR